VDQGGGLFATGNTALYTEWRQRKRESGLNELFQIKIAETGSERVSSIVPAGPKEINFGKGRVVYLPSVKPAIEKPAAAPMTSQYWKLALNHKDIIQSVR